LWWLLKIFIYKASTLQEFMKNLQNASETLKALNPISVSAGCDLFLRFITRTTHDVTVGFTIYYIQKTNFWTKKKKKKKKKIKKNFKKKFN